jgi:hypothetical protein
VRHLIRLTGNSTFVARGTAIHWRIGSRTPCSLPSRRFVFLVCLSSSCHQFAALASTTRTRRRMENWRARAKISSRHRFQQKRDRRLNTSRTLISWQNSTPALPVRAGRWPRREPKPPKTEPSLPSQRSKSSAKRLLPNSPSENRRGSNPQPLAPGGQRSIQLS